MDVISVKMSQERKIAIPKTFKQFKEGNKIFLIKNGDEIIMRTAKKQLTQAVLYSEKALAKDWLSQGDEQAFQYLQ